MLEAKIQKWGNSSAIRLPKALMDALLLKVNDPIIIRDQDGKITIEKKSRTYIEVKRTRDLLEEFYKKPIEEILADDTLYDFEFIESGPPVGYEFGGDKFEEGEAWE